MKPVIVTTLLGAVPAALAAEPAAPTAASPVLGAGSLGQLGLGLALTLGLIALLAWAVRRMPALARAQGPLRVLGSTAVGTRERVVLVEVEGVRLVLGVAPGRVTRLHAFEDQGFGRELVRQGRVRSGEGESDA